jgi:hypothetical protein
MRSEIVISGWRASSAPITTAPTNLNRDLDDSYENYEEAQSLHRLSSPAGARTALKKIAEVVLTKVTYPFILAADAFGKKSGTLDSRVF